MGGFDNPNFGGPPASVQEVAFRSWTGSANMSTGLAHPSDRDCLIDTIKNLRDSDYFVDPAEVRAWCTQWGFESRHVADIVELVAAMNAGKRLRKHDPRSQHWKTNIVDIWKKMLEEAQAVTRHG